MEVEPLVKTLPNMVAELEAQKLLDTLVDEKFVPLIDALNGTLADVQTKR